MKIYKKIEIELTTEEKHILINARDLIDIIANEMDKYNLTTISTDYDCYDAGKLDEIATDLHSLATVCEGE